MAKRHSQLYNQNTTTLNLVQIRKQTTCEFLFLYNNLKYTHKICYNSLQFTIEKKQHKRLYIILTYGEDSHY